MRQGKKYKRRDMYELLNLKQERFSIKNIGRYSVMPYRGGCGTAAISMLTGLHPKVIDKNLPKKSKYWTDKAMVSYLKKLGYGVKEITIERVVKNKILNKMPINYQHVWLVGQWVYSDDGTWSIVNGGARYHNFEMEPLSPFEFLNNPTDTVYAITHKKWE